MNNENMKTFSTEAPDTSGPLEFSHRGPEGDCLYFAINYNKTSNSNSSFSYSADSYISARTRLLRLMEKNAVLPEAILINYPFREKEFRSFYQWLQTHKPLAALPIIYNKEYLEFEELDILQESGLVDDISEIAFNVNFQNKVRFLSKVARYKQEDLQIKNQETKEKAWKNFCYLLNYGAKRTIDVLIASFLIILLLPVFLVISLIIRFESKGPIFYTALRAGRGFKVFKFYKFRTMVPDADKKLAEIKQLNQYKEDETGANFIKIKNDPRITRFGSFLRNTSLDELPQLFNVLKGDMCIVGNRPLPLYEASTLTTNEWSERFMAPAGITGLWQVKKRGMDDMSAEERLSLDIHYARKNSLINDLKIMANTPKALFQKSNV